MSKVHILNIQLVVETDYKISQAQHVEILKAVRDAPSFEGNIVGAFVMDTADAARKSVQYGSGKPISWETKMSYAEPEDLE